MVYTPCGLVVASMLRCQPGDGKGQKGTTAATLAHHKMTEGWLFSEAGVTFLLAWAFAAVGVKVRFSAISAIGLKAFLGGTAVALAAGGRALLLTKYLWFPLA